MQLKEIKKALDKGDIGGFEIILFMFDLIVNADDRETTIENF